MSGGAWILALTYQGEGDAMRDEWRIVKDEETARTELDAAMTRDDLYCACIGSVAEGTDPHWLDPDGV